ncbi:hypothetical protein BDN72DRAFT_177927 [Pluteus cervinus]|uniref:Uncharacterized protein n=1 Tax=Pluteus cervinus TaxID=181527 RepID=A0ACD3AJ93_9AGAR|nr:hypothetical protein BDN72DRAFT_177927 [Pluteus cervinus]
MLKRDQDEPPVHFNNVPSAPGSVPPATTRGHVHPSIPVHSIKIRVEDDLEENYKKLELFKNPKVKIKKVEDMQLRPDTIYQRLSQVGFDLYKVPLEKSLQDHAFPRKFIQCMNAYGLGGNIREEYPTVSSKVSNKTGITSLAFGDLVTHVHAPQVPGAPGLFFTTGRDRAEDVPEPRHTFTKLDSGWCYMGLYQFFGAPSLTKQEWATQAPKVLNAWAKKICERTSGFGNPVRARIACRKRGKKRPTEAEENAAIKDNSYRLVTKAEVKAAFSRGEEVRLASFCGFGIVAQRSRL